MASKLPKISKANNSNSKPVAASTSNTSASSSTASKKATAADGTSGKDGKDNKKPFAAKAAVSLPAISPSSPKKAPAPTVPKTEDNSLTVVRSAEIVATGASGNSGGEDTAEALLKAAEQLAVQETLAAQELQRQIEMAQETERAAQAAAAEARRLRGNGNVVLIYEQYNEEFPIVDGSTTQAQIDDVYCLSFVMPNCLIHLSVHDPKTRRKLEADAEADGKYVEIFLPEEPRGTYLGLEKDTSYYVYVEQEAEQLARDQARMREIAKGMDGYTTSGGGGSAELLVTKDDGRAMESCSCIYGNPCVDEYGCKDWGNRFAIANKNGWKGF